MTPEEFWQTLHQLQPEVATTYRLYHDDQGRPLFYSMEHLPGTYIEIDAQAFARSATNVRVVNNQLIEYNSVVVHKLTPNDNRRGTQCHPNDVSIVVKENGTYWSKQTYEQTN
jgi:hypothetical protein